jgi:nucleotide-binding universal stress UspA family protein
MTTTSGIAVRRIVLALDETPHVRAALDTAVRLAARLHADLVGIFVEDYDLLRVSELPFAAEISFFAPRPRPLDTASMQRSLRAQAARLRRMFEQAAREHGVSCEFRTRRGHVGAELLASAELGEMLVLEKAATRAAPNRLGRNAEFVADRLDRTVVLLHQGKDLAAPLVLAYDSSDTAAHAVDVAVQLAHARNEPLAVIIPPNAPREVRERATALPGAAGVDARVITAASGDSEALVRAAYELNCGTLIIDANSAFMGRTMPSALAVKLACPVVFVSASRS